MRVTESESIKLESLFSNLIDESRRIKSRENVDSIVLFTKKGNKYKPYNQSKIKKSTLKCKFCKKKGHEIDKCWAKNPALKSVRKDDDNDDTSESHQIAMPTIEYRQSVDRFLDLDNETSLNYSALFSRESMKSKFILDSGATTHICCDKTFFNEIRPINAKISWGKAVQIKASGLGDVSIIYKDTKRKAVLKDCLFIPEFDVNLISISLLLKKNYKILFQNNCKILDHQDTLVSAADNCNGLFIFPVLHDEKALTALSTTAKIAAKQDVTL